MRFIGRFLAGAALCAAGFLVILYFLDRSGTPEAISFSPPQGETAPAQPTPREAGAVGHPSNAGLSINAAGLDIIKESEGLRLDAYSAGGRWYIGYGHSRTARAGMTITESQAEALLREDVRDAENAVKRLITVPVNGNEFSAMASLSYNLGEGAFARSPVVSRLNAGDRRGAADAFRNHNRGGGQVIAHLTERREKERTLFLTP